MPKKVDEQWGTLQTPTTVEGFLEETESLNLRSQPEIQWILIGVTFYVSWDH